MCALIYRNKSISVQVSGHWNGKKKKKKKIYGEIRRSMGSIIFVSFLLSIWRVSHHHHPSSPSIELIFCLRSAVYSCCCCQFTANNISSEHGSRAPLSSFQNSLSQSMSGYYPFLQSGVWTVLGQQQISVAFMTFYSLLYFVDFCYSPHFVFSFFILLRSCACCMLPLHSFDR